MFKTYIQYNWSDIRKIIINKTKLDLYRNLDAHSIEYLHTLIKEVNPVPGYKFIAIIKLHPNTLIFKRKTILENIFS